MTTTDVTDLAGLPPRRGSRPTTGPLGGHAQYDQNGPAGLGNQLYQWMASLPGVYTGPSGISAPASRAVHLLGDLALGPDDAFVLHTEFAHLHAPADGSLHVTLPRTVVTRAIELGWAELHPAALAGARAPTLIMLYSPRNIQELEAVRMLVGVSYDFARGLWATPATGRVVPAPSANVPAPSAKPPDFEMAARGNVTVRGFLSGCDSA